MSKNIFLSPHNDDEVLFGSYTIMRERPLVVICTDSYIEQERGDDATTEERIEESRDAMRLLGVNLEFLHIPDKSFSKAELLRLLKERRLCGDAGSTVYAPAIEANGNWMHNAVGEVAREACVNVKHYMTYVDGNEKTKGRELVVPTVEERMMKARLLKCYPSQLRIKTTAPYFMHPEVLDWESFE